ncbi:MAG: pyridoxal phosphate-dependent aminotransferase [Halobacteriales archaeon]|nr:pyridoxal phosphate-dependent aminotransferase [Halobacteriales archaeon]
MQDYAARVKAVQPAAPFVIGNLVTELEEAGEDIVDLSVGQPDFDTPENIVEAAKDALDAGHTTYTESNGISALRRSIAEHKLGERDGLDYGPEHIMVTPGGKHALYETIQALVEPGDEVVMIDPVWSSYEPMVKLAGGEPVHVDLAPYDLKLEPGLDDLAAAITDDTALVMVNSPNNPSGMVFSDAAFDGVRDLAVEHDVRVISDEIYNEFIYSGEQQTSLASLDGMWERTITINGFSKSHCMTGFRLGYLAAPEALIDQVGKVHSHSVSCAGNFIQHAGIEALEGTDTDAFTGGMVETFRERRDLLVELFEERGFDMPVPEGSFYAMIPIETDDDMDWCKRAAREAKVGLVPGSAFNTPGYARASLVDSTERIQEGVDRLADAGFI